MKKSGGHHIKVTQGTLRGPTGATRWPQGPHQMAKGSQMGPKEYPGITPRSVPLDILAEVPPIQTRQKKPAGGKTPQGIVPGFWHRIVVFS